MELLSSFMMMLYSQWMCVVGSQREQVRPTGCQKHRPLPSDSRGQKKTKTNINKTDASHFMNIEQPLDAHSGSNSLGYNQDVICV